MDGSGTGNIKAIANPGYSYLNRFPLAFVGNHFQAAPLGRDFEHHSFTHIYRPWPNMIKYQRRIGREIDIPCTNAENPKGLASSRHVPRTHPALRCGIDEFVQQRIARVRFEHRRNLLRGGSSAKRD